MFRKILIANRGEIACRVIRTAQRLGIGSVAVYSETDRAARHVHLADEAYPIGPAPARESYLSIPRILDAARRSGAEAIHPGYGFLSENAEFAEACAAAGIAFIGPPVAAIRAMGSKSAAKSIMERSGVPLVPGYHGERQEMALLAEEAARIGYPVLIKASAGGGGKGMRVVEAAGDLEAAIEGAKREARASFGDDHVLIEKYLTRPRHIEIQVFADMQGNAVSLFERDCSIQRRHQKVIEEAPAPGLDEAQRRAMGEAAIAAARAVGYVGAGTVEFIAEDGRFFFMEMNTRLQVEHPVTEAITGQDLVEWQLRVAAGEPLPLRQEDLRIQGHAIEARIYAEDPSRDFLPSTGTLAHLRQPRESDGVRVDTGVRQGDAITPNYDPMIAKLIVHGEDRDAAARRLAAALAEYEVVGVRTNLALLRALATHPAFLAADLDTGFIARHPEVLEGSAEPVPDTPAWAAAAWTVLREEARTAGAAARGSGDPFSPWATADAWRMNGAGYQDLLFEAGDERVLLRAALRRDGSLDLTLPGGNSAHVAAEETEDGLRLRLDGVQHRMAVARQGDMLTVLRGGLGVRLRVLDPLAPPESQAAGGDRVIAPIPARVTRVLVSPGDKVAKGTPLLVLEAMKMELTLSAPAGGVVESIRHGVDEMVEEGTQLVTFATETA
ncbi:acetyl-propionyl-coenzyme A carboxylase alpha chain [Roseomonas sp. TAS13]|uniref:acetyl-CoA carboxylase biotin carboxylase subunit n=1 Tax=Roseomonas sp. TAS13 TaxID=1926319 RepID=UPI0009617A6F|nr:acetyl/propionyl/methylcrotonyl-CoA carboxylase subunit alpha [Roseomonas sp. TAS13]GAV32665.1 acetyl-propionyl-coenzyme A carboxylase alpha chain [Roseomonas sp. TAS13]